jgi:hypothetical protein
LAEPPEVASPAPPSAKPVADSHPAAKAPAHGPGHPVKKATAKKPTRTDDGSGMIDPFAN